MRLLLPLLAACAAAPQAPAPARVERHLTLMGTGLVLEVEAADRASALRASEAALRALEAAEARLSTWTADSELARLNAAPPGQAVLLSPTLAAELGAAADLWRATGGAFDPGVGALVAAWDLRGAGRQPDAQELARAMAARGLESLVLEGRRATRLHPDLVLEEGGFGKGAGLDAALAALRAAGASAGRLDLGGQLAFLDARPARARVADPRARGREVLELTVAGGSLATSGNSERARVVEGQPVGHLLDPRSGHPAPDLGSVTVWAPTALEADALSTGLFVLGAAAALDHAARHPGVEVLVLEAHADRLVARASAGLAGRIDLLTRDVTLDVAPRR